MTATETAPLIGGRYQIKDTLGRGGMATVYRAHDIQLQRDVALKLMRPDLAEDPVFEARFVNEARNAASITHPNVVTVLDFGTDGPGPYIVMELVDGGDLSRVIANDGPLPPPRAAAIAAEVATALQAAHAHGIVHRDVKPGNILLAADGHPRVADFGIARATGEQSLTGTGTSLGSVDYFSPEQARGEAATAASDIYALGVVLYEMLTGTRPFAGETAYAVAVARVDAAPPDPRAVRRSIPKALAGVVQRAMATSPTDRYGSAADMGRALETWLSRRGTKAAGATAAGVGAAILAPNAGAAAVGADGNADSPTAPTPVPAAAPAAAVAPSAAAAPAAAAGRAADTHAMATVATPPWSGTTAAGPMPLASPTVEPRPQAPRGAAAPAPERRRRRGAFLAAAAVVLIALIGFAGGRLLMGIGDDPMSGVLVGQPRGGVLPATPEPTEEPTPSPTPTREATPDPTVSPTPEVTPVPVVVAPVTPRPTPAPTPIAVAMAVTPDDTVATWYDYVASGQFDAAYALWSPRMKANYPREPNLDNRWDDTASITINQIAVTSMTNSYANVFIDFVETKDDGSSRRFVGSWDLVRSGDGWLLDNPNF